MPRILFAKVGEAVWISHLDLMRLFQRAFKRAGLDLTHTQGYNPRPSVSIALPLSVGVESLCELLDFDLEGEKVPCQQIVSALNQVLTKGIQVLDCYETGRKIRDLALLRCVLNLEYDGGVPADAQHALEELFASDSLIVPKKGKNGVVDQDIIPMIRSICVKIAGEKELQIDALICCQNPSLNPSQLVAAIERHCPKLKPDHAVCRREELYDTNETIFR
jgi:radical SAM-linked protein